MELPAIPKVILEAMQGVEQLFDIPLLMHPPIVHFIIAIPVIVLFLEIINIVVKKRTIGVISFLLLILAVVAVVAAYLTGNVDGKEAFPLLSETVQGELKEHKLLGTYLILASAVVLVFKLLSAMIGRGLMKALYLLVLILFVAGILKQGKEGGELVYTYGVNVEKVQELDTELDDLKEEIEELKEEAAKTPVEKAVNVVTETANEAKEAVHSKVSESIEVAEKKEEELQKKAVKAVETLTEKIKVPSVEVASVEETQKQEITTD